ncbi:MAG: ribosome maturation factor RimM, partial [Candidatus Binataceae bacterium]
MAAPQAAAIDAHSVAYVRIGRIGRRHGVHGAVVATLDHPESSTLETVRRVVLEDGAGRREYAIRRARRLGRRGVKLELEGVESPEGAEELRGRAILVAERDLPAVGPNEFYDFRAIGCEVVTTQGRRLGTVRE